MLCILYLLSLNVKFLFPYLPTQFLSPSFQISKTYALSILINFLLFKSIKKPLPSNWDRKGNTSSTIFTSFLKRYFNINHAFFKHYPFYPSLSMSCEKINFKIFLLFCLQIMPLNQIKYGYKVYLTILLLFILILEPVSHSKIHLFMSYVFSNVGQKTFRAVLFLNNSGRDTIVIH